MIKKLDKYSYAHGVRYMDHGTRNYDVAGYRLPSVTTILGKTKDTSSLDSWIASKGRKEAERIKNQSATRGTAMHKYLENYVLGKGYEDLTELGQETKRMAEKVIEVGLAPVSGYYGSEVTLYYPGLYAGQTDLVGVHKGQDAIMDFKQTNKPKKREWIEDYCLQLAAYAMAHNFIYKTSISKGIVMMCSKDNFYQEFVIEGLEFQKHKHNFLRRVDEYYKGRSKTTG